MLTIYQKFLPLFIVFITGSTITVLEILGIRILAPYIGTTIAVWTSMIGVILIAISGGYMVGGIIADTYQKKIILASIIALGSLFVVAIIPLKNFLSIFTKISSHGFTSLIGALFLFLLPAFFLGMVTIYVIRLRMQSINTVGTTSGTIYGVSTIGSIFGVFFSSFYLIPHFATSFILLVLAILLILTASLALTLKL